MWVGLKCVTQNRACEPTKRIAIRFTCAPNRSIISINCSNYRMYMEKGKVMSLTLKKKKIKGAKPWDPNCVQKLKCCFISTLSHDSSSKNDRADSLYLRLNGSIYSIIYRATRLCAQCVCVSMTWYHWLLIAARFFILSIASWQ